MAIFYGMFTWLTHTLFAVNLVFIPSGTVYGILPSLTDTKSFPNFSVSRCFCGDSILRYVFGSFTGHPGIMADTGRAIFGYVSIRTSLYSVLYRG